MYQERFLEKKALLVIMSGLISKTIQKLKNIFNPQNEEFLRLSLVQIDFERLRYSFNPFS